VPGPDILYDPAQYGQPEDDLYPQDKEQHDKLLQRSLELYQAADRQRKDTMLGWRKQYRLYRSWVKKNKADWRSRVFIPLCFYTVETVIPKVTAQLPKAIVHPVEASDDEPAKLMEEVLEWSFDQSNLARERVRAWRSAIKHGTGILKVYHDQSKRRRRITEDIPVPIYETVPQPVIDPETGQPLLDPDGQPVMEEVEVQLGEEMETQERVEDFVSYDGPFALAVDIENFWVAPESTSIEDARYSIERAIRDEAEFRKAVEEGLYRLPDGMDIGDLWPGDDSPNVERLAEIDRGTTKDPTRKATELLEIWTDQTVLTVANQLAVVRVQRNPFDHGEKPYVVYYDYGQEQEFWGIGEIEVLEGVQDALNSVWNQRIDNVKLAMNQAGVVNVDKLHDPRDLERRPGQVIRVRGEMLPSEVYVPIQIPDVTSSAYTEAAELERLAEKISAVSAYQTGTDSPTLNDTATGIALISEQGNTRFSHKVQMAEIDADRRLARLYGSILQQFTDEDIVIRRQAPQSGQSQEALPQGNGFPGPTPMGMADPVLMAQEQTRYEWVAIRASDIQGALDYDIESGSSTVTESMRREQAVFLFQTLYGVADPATGVPIVPAEVLVEDLLEAYGKKDLDRYRYSTGAMLGMLQQAIAQQQEAAPNGQASVPEEQPA
jgi:hypothetical protein